MYYELVLRASQAQKWCIYGYIWLYAAIYSDIYMYITLENIYMHLVASFFMVIYRKMLVYAQICAYIDAFWVAFGPVLHDLDKFLNQFKCVCVSPSSFAFGPTVSGKNMCF